MRFSLFLLSAACALASSPLLAQNSGGKITFQGQIIPQTCEATIDNEKDAIVTLRTVRDTEFPNPGSTAGLVKFTLKINNCSYPEDENYKIRVQLKPEGKTENGDLVNAISPAAKGAPSVAVRLFEDAEATKKIAFRSSGSWEEMELDLPFSGGEASHTFSAQYVRTNDKVPSLIGKVSAVVTYKVIYL